jgi:hypothetical protein
MLYRFRICPDPDQPDTAQGWVITSNEIEARQILGKDVHLMPMPKSPPLDVPMGTVFVTEGSLASA